jgi:hypothetical protein
MSQSFTLHVPAAAPYRALGSDIATRFSDLSGGNGSDGQALSSAVAAAIDDLVRGDDSGDVELAFQHTHDGYEVTVRYRGRSTVVRHGRS